MADVDVGDCLDLLAGDARTRAILVYLESVPAPRKFLSAARAASRLKPVIALKAGRGAEAARAAATHTGGAVRRRRRRRRGAAPSRGARVSGLSELFAAAETVGALPADGAGAPRRRHQQRRRRGARARPASRRGGGQLAALAPETLAGARRRAGVRVERREPGRPHGRCRRPIAISPALEAVAADAGVDAILVMHTPDRRSPTPARRPRRSPARGRARPDRAASRSSPAGWAAAPRAPRGRCCATAASPATTRRRPPRPRSGT